MTALLYPPTKPLSAQEMELVQGVLDYVTQFSPLNDIETKGLIDGLNIQTHKKGSILLREGQIPRLCYFVLKGCVRQYYLVDGEERTTNFFSEGQPINTLESTLKISPSKFYLSCLEECVLTQGSPEDEAKLFARFPVYADICRLAVEDELSKNQNILANFRLSSPEERYLNLVQTRPELIDRVPQYQLASYLGIKPESLSRIRKRIMQK